MSKRAMKREIVGLLIERNELSRLLDSYDAVLADTPGEIMRAALLEQRSHVEGATPTRPASGGGG